MQAPDSLHIRASEGDELAAAELLGSGADVNAVDGQGCTALHWAADRGRLGMIRLLLRCGADVGVTDADGQTPLHYALMCDQQEVDALSHILGCCARKI
jgi:ankyrin repeat protein